MVNAFEYDSGQVHEHLREGEDEDPEWDKHDEEYLVPVEKSSTTDEERVEDLVYHSGGEPPAKRTRTRTVKRRGFGGCWASAQTF